MSAYRQTALRTEFAASAPSLPACDGPDLPAVGHGLAYHLAYWRAVTAGLLRPHTLHGQAVAPQVSGHAVTPEQRRRWREGFDMHLAGDGEPDAAFLYAQSTATLLMLRLFAALGLNLRHLRHLRNSVVHPAGQAAYLAAERQVLDCRLLRRVRVGKHDVLLVVGTTVGDGSGRVVARVEDSFVVGGLVVTDAATAENDPDVRRALWQLRLRLPELDAGAAGGHGRTLYVAPDAAQRFGALAGDFNPIHRSRAGARLFGQRRPFVPGMYLRNLVARELAEWGLPVLRLSITFTAKVQPGETLVLLQQGERFELTDSGNRLVAFGRC